ncbi:MAG: lamin tail domain-containing protein, partial [Thermoplasmata archaeon]|nr:lamin tail domain-containing protein [Thermoplasmata archaeon]
NPDTDGDDVLDRVDLAPLDPSIGWHQPSGKVATIQGQDTVHIFIDTDCDATTGYHSPWMPVGADYMIEVVGKYGYVFSSSYQRFIGTPSDEWNWSFINNINVGTDAECLETQINLKKLGIIQDNNFAPLSNRSIDVFFHITNWANSTEDCSDCVLNNLEGLKETPRSITILNPYTNATQYDWIVNFKTTGHGKIIIGNGSFPYDVDFKGLYYFDLKTGKYIPMIVEIDVDNQIIVADWRYRLGKVVFRPHVFDGNYTLEIIYSERVQAYYNSEPTRGQPRSPNVNNDTEASTGEHSKPMANPLVGIGSRNPQGTNVVINEIFPDQKNTEWIELYNPTASTIDLSGWTITTSAGTYTFPGAPGSSTVTIGPGQFLVLDNTDFGNSYLKNSEDSVVLRDPNNIIIDQTTYRGVSKDKSWARYKDPTGADGFDTDQDSDWYKDNNPTKGASNSTTIPEYQNLFLPLIIILAVAIFSRRYKLRKRKSMA